MFEVKNLNVEVEGKPIVKNFSLKIGAGEIHAIMGPNGSGKSTLASAIMGHPKYVVTGGQILVEGEDVVPLKADKRSHRGLFLAFQYPKEIPGVSVTSFMQMAVNAVRKAHGQEPLNPLVFRKLLRSKMQELSLDAKFMTRSMNEGFSGGEKKKVEILQMALLEPKLAVLDETDSGLDVDALKTVSEGINRLASATRSMLIITHYQRILHYVKPHFVHVMIDGRIVKSGGPGLGQKLEKEGYEWVREEIGALSS